MSLKTLIQMIDFMTKKGCENGTSCFTESKGKSWARTESFQGKHWKLQIIGADFPPNPFYWVSGYPTSV